MSVVVLKNDLLEVKIDTLGAELSSVKEIATGKEYIWDAKPDVWKRHAPVLFPVVGKYLNGISKWAGKEYKLGQHGFARDMEFEVVKATENEAEFKLVSNDATKEKYPFDFELICGFILEGKTLTAVWKVYNPMEEEIYFSIGGHPAFVDGDKTTLTGYALSFDTKEESLKYFLLNENGAKVNKELEMPLVEKKMILKEDSFDKDALVIEDAKVSEVVLLDKEGKRVVSVSFDAPVFGLWSAAGKKLPYVCIEPWYGRTDAEDFAGELKDREYSNTLKAKETFEKSFKMTFGE